MGLAQRMRSALALLCAIAITAVVSLPLQGEETGLLQEKVGGLFSNDDDQHTVEAEVNEAIQHDVNMDSLNDIGESMQLGAGATDWEKKAAADINAMSRTGIAKAQLGEDDTLTAKFQKDIKEAQARLATPKKKVSMESEIEQEADKALKDPTKAKALRAEAEKAELDLETNTAGLGVASFIQESTNTDDDEDDDLGEDDDDEQFQLMGGSDEDVSKAINDAISQKVNLQLGSIPVNTGDDDVMKQFEEDKVEAQKFLDQKAKAKKDKANAEIQKQLKEAQAALTQSQAEEGSEEQRK